MAVRFRDDVSTKSVDSLLASFGANVVRPPRPDSGFFYYVVSYPRDSIEPLRVAAQLYTNPLVQWTEPDRTSAATPHYVPSDTYYPLQYFLHNTSVMNGVTVDDDVQRAWDLSLGNGINVGILDDGVDQQQGDYIYTFAGAQSYDLMVGYRTSDTPWIPYCNDNHGTSVMGIIGAQHNGSGVAGIAPGIVHKLVRGFRRTYPCNGIKEQLQSATDVQLADGLNWLWQCAHADVMSNSWGGGAYSQAIADAIHNAVTLGRGGLGTPVIFSAGNTSARDALVIGQVTFPATLSDVITVSAIDRNGAITDYSPQGKIDVVAPSGHYTGSCSAGDMVTTDRAGAAGCNNGPNGDINYTANFSGTSAAAPQVAAIAALMLSRYPSLTAATVKTRLRNTAVPWGDPTLYGAGKVSAYNAIY